jgi:hypothetical protein
MRPDADHPRRPARQNAYGPEASCFTSTRALCHVAKCPVTIAYKLNADTNVTDDNNPAAQQPGMLTSHTVNQPLTRLNTGDTHRTRRPYRARTTAPVDPA